MTSLNISTNDVSVYSTSLHGRSGVSVTGSVSHLNINLIWISPSVFYLLIVEFIKNVWSECKLTLMVILWK